MADRADFDGFVESRSPRLLRTAYLLTRDWALAEDLLQTALAKAWFAWSRIEESPEAYVRRTMVTTYTSWWRRKWRAEVSTGRVPERTQQGHSDASDERAVLADALTALPPRQRAVVVLRYYEDLTEAETARILGCSVGTVKSQHAKALAKLRINPTLASERHPDESTGTIAGRS